MFLALKDKKGRTMTATENTSDSEVELRFDKLKHSKQKPATPRRGQKVKQVSPIKPKIDAKASKNVPKRPVKKVEVIPEKPSESSSNSSTSSSGRTTEI